LKLKARKQSNKSFELAQLKISIENNQEKLDMKTIHNLDSQWLWHEELRDGAKNMYRTSYSDFMSRKNNHL